MRKKPDFGKTSSRKTDNKSTSPQGGGEFKPRFHRTKVTTTVDSPKAKAAAVVSGFEGLWEQLFTSPVHLDSSLSKLPTRIKSILAQIMPRILLRPVSEAEILGVGVPDGQPWNLVEDKKLSGWRPAHIMASRIYELMEQRPPEILPVTDDFPPYMIEEWKKDWGPKVVADLVDTLGREAPLSLRASRKVGPSVLLTALTENGPLPVRTEISNLVPLGVRLSGYVPVLGTDSYKNGTFEIQDEGSQLMALFALWPERYGAILKPKPGSLTKIDLPAPPLPKETPAWTVIDTCAGAGGKSLALADALKGKGRIYAYDTSAVKLQALRRRATRAGVNNIQTTPVRDGSESEVVDKFKAKANVVLVDAPCSGWGVLRRNPDIKWRQQKDVLLRMPQIQLRLLSVYSDLVASGGRLVFGVCTFRPAETTEVVEKFLAEHPEFKAVEGGYMGPGPCDGFFMQAMVKA
jgi:16S rRNA C967 or C1407 C5-methylase (RsmB/RsmF family)